MKITSQLDMDVVALEAEDTVTCLLTFEAPLPEAAKARPAETLIVVLDRSGSMAGPELEAAKIALHSLVDVLMPQDTFGLVTFDSQARIAVPTRSMADHDLPTVHALIEGIEAGSTTDLSAGYLLGLREAKRHRKESGASVMVLSDGYANEGTTDIQTVGQLATKARDRGITTVTIGIGENYDDSLLEEMATRGQGSHRFASTPDDATAVVAQEAGDLLTKSIVNAFVRIRPSDAVGIDGVGTLHDVPRWIEKDSEDRPTVVIPLGDIYAGETRELLVQFLVSGLPALGSMEIAEIIADFVSLPDFEAGEVRWPLEVGVVDSDERDAHTPDPQVRVAALLAEAVTAKREAVEALQRHDAEAAERALRNGAERLETQMAENLELPEGLRHRLDEEHTHFRALQVGAREQGLEYSRRRIREDVNLNSRGRADELRRTRARCQES